MPCDPKHGCVGQLLGERIGVVDPIRDRRRGKPSRKRFNHSVGRLGHSQDTCAQHDQYIAVVFDCADESQWDGIEFQYLGIGCHMQDYLLLRTHASCDCMATKRRSDRGLKLVHVNTEPHTKQASADGLAAWGYSADRVSQIGFIRIGTIRSGDQA